MVANAMQLSNRLAVAMVADKLCKDRTLAKVTTGDICEGAGISRPTFYRLFEDKYAIAPWVSKFAMERGLKEVGRTLTFIEGHTVSIEGIGFFKNLIIGSVDPNGIRTPSTIGAKMHEEYMRETLTQYKNIELDTELEFQISFYATASTVFMSEWLGGNIMLSSGELAEMFAKSCPSRLYDLLRDPVNPQPFGQMNLATLYRPWQ